jgi:hypothetical protein
MMAMSLLAGRYELVARIGVGGYGEVWRGTDSVLARPVAIKLLQAEHTIVPEAMMRFRAEARHAGALSHPCIAHVYDYCEPGAPDPPFLVMELVDGLSLAELLTRGPLDVARAMDVIGQAAAGLSAAHQAGLVHRDIKPGNLLISRGGPVKITDFGIAQARVPASSGPVTMTGMVLGTAGYMAPERVEGNQATVASDLYALGVVAYECLAGLLPRGGAGLRTGEPTPGLPAIAPRTAPLPPLPASIPADVAALVARLTARDPARRPATAGEVARQAAALRDKYRDAPPRASAAPEAGADDTAWDQAFPDGSGPDGSGPGGTGLDGTGPDGTGPDVAGRDRTAVDGAARNGAGPDQTAVDRAVRNGAAPAERSTATGPLARPAGRGPGRPRRTLLAIVLAAVTGLALLTFGVLEVIHQRDVSLTLAAPPSASATTNRTIDLRESALVGEQLSTVRSQLRRDGLRVRVLRLPSSLPSGQVLKVLPSGSVRPGSVITVYVAAMTPPTSAITPSGQILPPGHGAVPSIKPTPPASPSPSPDKSPPLSTSPSPTTSPTGSPSPSGSPSGSPSPDPPPSS